MAVMAVRITQSDLEEYSDFRIYRKRTLTKAFDALAAGGRRGQEEDQGTGNYYVTDPVESRNFERFLGLMDGRRVLVVGCGDGLETELLCRRGYEVTATDLSPDMVTATHRRLEEQGLVARLFVEDVTDIHVHRHGVVPIHPWPFYDGIMFAEVAPFIGDDDAFRRAVGDLASLLSDGGVLMMSTTFYQEAGYERTWSCGDEVVGATTYHRRTIDGMVPVVRNAGLSVVDVEHFDSREVFSDETYQNDYVFARRKRQTRVGLRGSVRGSAGRKRA